MGREGDEEVFFRLVFYFPRGGFCGLHTKYTDVFFVFLCFLFLFPTFISDNFLPRYKGYTSSLFFPNSYPPPLFLSFRFFLLFFFFFQLWVWNSEWVVWFEICVCVLVGVLVVFFYF